MKSFDDWYFELFESGNGACLNQQEIAEEAWDFRQAEVDELQKRIDGALDHAVNHGGYDDLTHIINILKGDQS